MTSVLRKIADHLNGSKSDEDCGGSSRHHQNDQCSDEDSSDSS